MLNINFTGYDAAPLKSIYHSRRYSRAFIDEMIEAGNSEGIRIKTISDDQKWAQDNKSFVEKNGRPYLIGDNSITNEVFDTFKLTRNIRGQRDSGFLTGGNTFIGKFKNGEKWLIAGDDSEIKDKDKISKAYGIKPENIHFLPQQNYHLDMYLRPVGFPYILVNDPKLVKQNIDKLKGSKKEKELFKKEFNLYRNFQERIYGYCSVDTTVKELKKLGFKPIRIAGDYGWYVNFMNAIVNKRPDGTISYITNSSKCNSPLYSSIEEIFKKDLTSKLPDLKNVYFIQGKKEPVVTDRNFIMGNLKYGGGGIHCMSLEEPDFQVWA